MIDSARKFFATRNGQFVAVGLIVVALVGAFVFIRGSLHSEVVDFSRDRTFIDGATGKAFKHEAAIGDTLPLKAPSGGMTGYPAEFCYWTKDGKIKKDPTPVLLNAHSGKPGPTFCPDCGRLVIGHNPVPSPNDKPPPTQAEYNSQPKRTAAEK